MDVALTGEGTYPHHFGGVSVWCDQLIRGMPDRNFRVVALVATGTEQVRWELPHNVVSVDAIALWGYQPAMGHSRLRANAPSIAVRELIDLLLQPERSVGPAGGLPRAGLGPAESARSFGDVLRELFEVAQRGSLAAELASDKAAGLLSSAWRDRWPDCEQPTPSLHDAATAMQLLEHSLRPLAHPPFRADLGHAVTNGLGVLPALAAKWRHSTPILLTEHGMYMREQYLHNRRGPFRWPVKALHLSFLRRLCALGYQEAEIIAPGNVYNTRWEQRLGADPARIRTVYNGVNPADFPAVADEPEVPTITWAGRIDPVKDLETLLRAFALVRRQLPAARLRMFGSAPRGQDGYLERCRSLAASLGISEAATFEGRIAKIRDAYAAGHVVVLCSITEGFPYTLIEAMTCARACVASNVGGVSEALADTGLVVPPRNPEALAKACLTLLTDTELRRDLAARARHRALEFFTVDRAMRAYDELYVSVGASRSVPVAQPEPGGESADQIAPASAAVPATQSDDMLATEVA